MISESINCFNLNAGSTSLEVNSSRGSWIRAWAHITVFVSMCFTVKENIEKKSVDTSKENQWC